MRAKIAYFYNNKDFGGPVINVRNYTRFLDAGRFQPVIFFSRMAKEIEPIVQEYHESHIPVHFISHLRPSVSNKPFEYVKVFAEFPSVVNRFAKVIRADHIHIVHTNTIGDLQAMFAAKLTGTPLLATVREIYIEPRWATYMLARFVYLLADRVTCVSRAVMDSMFSFTTSQNKISVIHNGVDYDYFDPAKIKTNIRDKYSISPRSKIVGLIGLMDPWKGHHILLEAIPSILQKHPDTVFVFVGGESKRAISERYKGRLISRARELGIANQIIFAGYCRDVRSVLAALDVFVHTSVSPDPFPTTILEAMAMEKPIVASKSGGVLEQIEDGENGILVPPNDSRILASKIDLLLARRGWAEKIGKKARVSAKENFNWSRSISSLTKLYDELLVPERKSG